MFSIFPSDWEQPKPKNLFGKNNPISEGDSNINPINKGTLNYDFSNIPAEEMCLGETPVDTREIDQLLFEIEKNRSTPNKYEN
jgi:hypothetical protein